MMSINGYRQEKECKIDVEVLEAMKRRGQGSDGN